MNQIRKFNAVMDVIGNINREVRRWLTGIPVEKWTRAHDGGKRWGILTTNYVEVFNNVLKGSRNMPITACVQLTFYRTVKYFDVGRTVAQKAQRKGLRFTSQVQKAIEKYQGKANEFDVTAFNRSEGIFEVKTSLKFSGGHNRQVVHINKPSCSCGTWEIYKYPCSHMLAVTAELGVDYFHLVASEYTMDVFTRIWDPMFQPMPHEDYWVEPDAPITLIANPKRLRPIKVGRAKSTRIHNEMDIPRTRMTKQCSLCSANGHDKRTCPQRPRRSWVT